MKNCEKRHDVSYESVRGELSAVARTAVGDWKKDLPNLIDKYEQRDIFNAGDTGLFFRVLTNKTTAFKKRNVPGWKMFIRTVDSAVVL